MKCTKKGLHHVLAVIVAVVVVVVVCVLSLHDNGYLLHQRCTDIVFIPVRVREHDISKLWMDLYETWKG